MPKIRIRKTDVLDQPFVKRDLVEAMFFLLYRKTFAWRRRRHRTTDASLWLRPVYDVYVVMVNTQSDSYERIVECVYKASYVGSITEKEFFVGKLDGSIHPWVPQNA